MDISARLIITSRPSIDTLGMPDNRSCFSLSQEHMTRLNANICRKVILYQQNLAEVQIIAVQNSITMTILIAYPCLNKQKISF